MKYVSLSKISSSTTGLRSASLSLLRRRPWPRLKLIARQILTNAEAMVVATEEDVAAATTAGGVAALAQLTSAELFTLVREF